MTLSMEAAVAGNGQGGDVGTRKVVGKFRGGGGGKPLIVMICGSLVYYHCAYRNSSLVSLVSDVFIVLLCSLAILGLLFRQMNIQVPVDPLEWQISQDSANSIFACLANTIGAAESVLRVAATGHDKRLFFKVVASLYLLSALGRLVSTATVAYAGLCLLCLYMLTEESRLMSTCFSWFSWRRDCPASVQD
ncbi:reticulon-like protein B22 [Coffea eugenioides]|uniref:Reticulon-like protein B22 isoform X1 n=1 Tax=Coffea arabica TaxID=13443 RepID=A0A6P6XAF3_COFAR|nr:reticulon-like protein B22 [Coffea arabica]XP_027168108.1 reticulon-like protein B22 [Coffea eugenioides]